MFFVLVRNYEKWEEYGWWYTLTVIGSCELLHKQRLCSGAQRDSDGQIRAFSKAFADDNTDLTIKYESERKQTAGFFRRKKKLVLCTSIAGGFWFRVAANDASLDLSLLVDISFSIEFQCYALGSDATLGILFFFFYKIPISQETIQT